LSPLPTQLERGGKAAKLAILTELVTTLDAPDGGWLVSETTLPAMMEMVGVNVFRALPPSSEERRAAATRRIKTGGPSAAGVEGAGGGGGGSEGGEGGGGDDEPTLEPSWPHLELVYELLLRVIMHPDVSAAAAVGWKRGGWRRREVVTGCAELWSLAVVRCTRLTSRIVSQHAAARRSSPSRPSAGSTGHSAAG
jgi:hypothetical protein